MKTTLKNLLKEFRKCPDYSNWTMSDLKLHIRHSFQDSNYGKSIRFKFIDVDKKFELELPMTKSLKDYLTTNDNS